MKPTFPLPRPRRQGFSLVEVTVAMGIVATVLVALLALLPYGMDSIREAKSTQVQARIANEIISELQVADWGSSPTYSKLAEYDGIVRGFSYNCHLPWWKKVRKVRAKKQKWKQKKKPCLLKVTSHPVQRMPA